MFIFGLTSKHHQSIAKHFAKWIVDSKKLSFLAGVIGLLK